MGSFLKMAEGLYSFLYLSRDAERKVLGVLKCSSADKYVYALVFPDEM